MTIVMHLSIVSCLKQKQKTIRKNNLMTKELGNFIN